MRFNARIVLIIAALHLSSVVGASGKTPNDPYYSYQTTLTVTTPPEASLSRAWEITTDASDIVVAVIDTGVDLNHEDLKKNLWVNTGEIDGNGIDDDGNGYIDDVHGYDFKNKDGIPKDERGHGTLIAGILGAVGDNKIGTAGVAWSVQIMVLKVFGASGGGKLEDFTAAIRYAVHNHARIINASWTIPPGSTDNELSDLKQAIHEADDAGVLVIAAAGNEASDLDKQPVYPAAYAAEMKNVISVAALSSKDAQLLKNSSYGLKTVTIATEGEEIIGPYLGGGYATLTGTSSATAVVSGLSALMLSKKPQLTPSEIRDIFVSSSVPSTALINSVISGGVLNPSASLLALDSSTTSSRTTIASIDPSPSSGGCSLIVMPQFHLY